jgi:hypothetical protein
LPDLLGALLAPIVAAGCASDPIAPPKTSPDPVIQEARTRFTYRGVPIPPFFLNDFAGGPGAPDYWKVGMGHRIAAVAVEGLFTRPGYDTSPYDLLPTRRIGPFYAFDYYEGSDRTQQAYGGYYGYRFIGTTPGGITVLEYVLCTGGSAVCYGVVLVRFSLEDLGAASTDPHKRLVMRFLDQMSWGDRVSRSVSLEENRLLLGPATSQLPGPPNPVEPALTIVLE